VNNLSFKYPSKEKYIFKCINTELKKGDIVALRGASGSGKSTFVNLLINLYKPTSGEINFFDSNENILNVDQCSFSYLAQETIILDTNLRDNVAFGMPNDKIIDYEILHALKLAKLDSLLKDMNIYEPLGERGLTLSGGQRQRLSIARMFYRKGNIIILDEITSGLDKNTESEIFKNIFQNNQENIIIVISHNPEIWSLCNNFIDL
jgi:ABC-type bacteriocin/lantibiotic exporter with double-glycine peptidase domain